MTSSDPGRRTAWIVFATLVFAYAYFYQAGGWNQNSRMDLVRAIVFDRSVIIDSYAANTGDRAVCGDHVCSDKAPGLALAAVPPVLAASVISDDLGFLSYIATLFTAGLAAAFAALVVFSLARRLGTRSTVRDAVVVALIFGLATPMWCYATLFMSHAMVSALLVGAYRGALAVDDAAMSVRRRRVIASLIGLALGWAIITEYPVAIPAAIVGGLAVWQVRKHGRREALWVGAALVGGISVAAAVLLIYNAVAFGSPFQLGYSGVTDFPGMKAGVMGVTYPKWHVLGELLVGHFRGLLRLSPVLALAPLGLAFAIRERKTRAAGIVAAAIVAYYLLFNAAYFYWNGGFSYGPRHMAPALAFAVLGLVPLWTCRPARLRIVLRVAIVALAGFGATLSLAAVATTAQPSMFEPKPIENIIWPAFTSGRLALNHQSIDQHDADADQPQAAWNLGQQVGLDGFGSLVPLAILLIAGTAAAVRGRLAADREPADPLVLAAEPSDVIVERSRRVDE
jgi:hypothetical protein